MLNERKLTERELDKRAEAIQGLLSNKRTLVKKYGKDAEKVMYGIATKQAKSKVENMNKEKIKELIQQAITIPPTPSLEEGHGLDQKDLDTLESLRNQIEQGILDKKNRIKFVKVLDFLIKSNIQPGDLKEDKVNENIEESEVDEAIMDLRNLVDQIEDTADDAREIVRKVFPSELSRLDGYGAFNAMYSANRYDVTLGGFVDRLEEEGYEIEDGVAYVNEDLDVGHQDDEPGMLKAELARAGKMVQMLYRAIDKYDDQGEVDFPQWWQKKIIKANSMLDSAFDYLDGQESVAKIDAMIDTINEEEDEVKKRLAVDKAVKSTLKDEGGAAGLDPLAKAVKKLGVSKDELKSMIKKIVGVAKHKHGDYISTPINEAMDGGQLFDYFNNKGYDITERSLDGRKPGFEGYMVSKGDGPYPQSVIFQHNKDTDQFTISRMGGYKIDQKEAIKAGMREAGSSGIVGRDAYITDGNYTPVSISVDGLKRAVDHVMGGLEREASAQADFYRARGRTSGTIDEKELSKKDVKDLKKISKQLDKSVKAHDTQAKRISKIVKEKLTKRSKVDDFVDDFKKSDAKQFKGKSAEKKRKMAVAAYLAKQNDK